MTPRPRRPMRHETRVVLAALAGGVPALLVASWAIAQPRWDSLEKRRSALYRRLERYGL